MPAVARGDGVDSINTVHNAIGKNCAVAPTIISTDKKSSNVFAENTGVVRVGDTCESHTFPSDCKKHATPLVTGSGTVRVNNKPVGRIGDTHSCGAKIISGAGTVFAGG